jgi:hypothetical protein
MIGGSRSPLGCVATQSIAPQKIGEISLKAFNVRQR